MKKLLPFLLLLATPALAQSYSNLQFNPLTGQVANPTTTPYATTYPTTLALFNINDPLIVLTSGTYSNPTWLSTLAWSKITGTPTTVAGYGITNSFVFTTSTYADPSWLTAIHWSIVDTTPTSAAGYGILNGANLDNLGTLGGSAYYTNASNLASGTLPVARFPAFVGDVTTTAGGVTTALATVNASPGTYGSSTQNAQFTVNGKGLITAITSVTESNPWSSLTGTPTTLAGYGITDGVNAEVNDTNVTGAIAGHTLTLGWTGTLAAGRLNANTPQSIVNDTNVTGSIAAQALTLGWTGTLAAGRLNSSVVESVVNDTNFTGSIAGQALTLGFTGTMAAARLNANVVEAITNDTNITGSITAQNLSLGFAGQLSLARGGTGQSTAANAYNALSPTTTLGDVAYANGAGTNTRLAGNTSATRQFLGQTGNGTISAAPAWTALATSDIPTISLSTGVNGTLQAAQEPAHTGDATNSAGSLAMTVVKINGVQLSGLATGILKNTTATGVPSIAVAGTDYLGLTGGSTITSVGALTSGSLAAGFTAVPITIGGTGQTTALAGFNALSPLTTAGDLLYGGTAGTGTRLGIGSTGQVLTVSGGLPAWSAAATGNVSNSGTPTNGQLALWTNATTLQGLTALPAGNFGALTGDVTNSAGSYATTVGKINGTSLAGLATGILKNTTTTGVPSIAAAGTDYLAPFGSQTANFFYGAPNGSAGVPSFRALVAADIPVISAATGLSATLAQAQFPALTGDVTNSAGSLTTTVGKINGVSLGSLTTGILKNTTTTGVPSIAVSGTDYQAPFGSQAANTVYAAPSGGSGLPSFRVLAAVDIPVISATTQLSGTLQAAQEPAHTGDATNTAGSLAMTVARINGTSLAGLSTGLLKNTTGTGVPSIGVAGTDYQAPMSGAVGQISTTSNVIGLVNIPSIATLKGLSVSGLTTGYQVSVLGYYAAGDGGGGTYIYNSASAATDNGGSIIQPTSGTGRWLLSWSGTFTVKQFGAKGDNSTDDTTSIQAAINAMNTAGGGIVYFPSSLYHTTAQLTLGGNYVLLVGAGFGASQITSNVGTTFTQLLVQGSGATPGTISTYSAYDGVRDLGFVRGYGASAQCIALQVSYTVSCHLDRVYTSGSSIGTYLLGTVDLFMDSCNENMQSISATNGIGVDIDGAQQNASCYISNTIVGFGNFTGTNSYGYYVNGAHLADLYVSKCEGDSCQYGLYYNGGSVASAYDTVDVHFYQFVADTVSLYGMFFVNCADNASNIHLTSCYSATTSASAVNLAILSSSGISVDGYQAITSSNACGVYLTGSENIALHGMVIKGPFLRGIWLNGTNTDVSINGNIIEATATVASSAALTISTSTKLTISNNIFSAVLSDTWRYYILVADGTSDNTTVTGNVFDPNGNTFGVGSYINFAAGGNTQWQISGNSGYNPQGATVANPTVGASPWTYTNSTGVNLTVYISGGTVSSVTVDGRSLGLVSGETVRLPTGKAMVVTYTVIPTVNVIGD